MTHMITTVDIADRGWSGKAVISVTDIKKVKVSGPLSEGWEVGTCPYCGYKLKYIYNPKYCGYCGKAVKWDD